MILFFKILLNSNEINASSSYKIVDFSVIIKAYYPLNQAFKINIKVKKNLFNSINELYEFITFNNKKSFLKIKNYSNINTKEY